jgi:hypothetical protein
LDAGKRRQGVKIALVVLLVALIGAALARPRALPWISDALTSGPAAPSIGDPPSLDQIVQAGGSIAGALLRANQGTTIFVEPGEYREQVRLREGVRIVSRVPRAATIRLPATAAESDAAVIAAGLASGELAGFRIVGDAATPLGTGIQINASAVSIVDVEVIGATRAALEFEGGAAALMASDVHDNPGAAMVIRTGSTPRIAHNAFARNGMAQLAATPFAIDHGARPIFQWNTFTGTGPEAFNALEPEARLSLSQQNWFVKVQPAAGGRSRSPR